MINLNLAGLLARLSVNTFPLKFQQWFEDSSVVIGWYKVDSRKNSHLPLLFSNNPPYSYGDSAGITPDFPFNPERSGTKFVANVYRMDLNQQKLLLP